VSTRNAVRVWAATLMFGMLLGACGDAQTGEPRAADAYPYADPMPTASFVEPCEGAAGSRPVAGGLPSMTLRCLGPGPAVDPATLRGRPTVVNLWATWCLPCQREMPALQRVHERFGDGVRFVGVDTRDDAAGAVEFLRTVGVTYAQTVDLDGELLRRLRIPGLPNTVVLDRDGRIAYKTVGPIKEAQLNAQLQAVL
jgi:cytochrome c biogenesis protein CcmG/thiol:disulfide interchange protein DsbE